MVRHWEPEQLSLLGFCLVGSVQLLCANAVPGIGVNSSSGSEELFLVLQATALHFDEQYEFLWAGVSFHHRADLRILHHS